MKNRILSSFVLVLLFLPFVLKGDILFAGFILAVGLIAFYELFHLRLKERNLSLFTEILAYFAVGFLILNHYQSKDLMIVLDDRVLSLFLFIFLVPLVIIGDNKKYNLQDAVYLLGSVLFIGLSFNLMILIRNNSLTHFIYLILITSVTDIFAYLAGNLIGKNRLAKNISPNKTIEGALVGLGMGTFVGVLYYSTVIHSEIAFPILILITAILSMMGQIGDLIFSQIKRYYQEKDFSKLIPGHGGILDLLDSLIFATITIVLFMEIL